MHTANAALSICLLSAPLLAQAPEASLKPFQASPAASVTQELGISSLRIDYHRPAVKGRAIWGGLVPYGQVWRAGANDATVFTLSDPAKIAGKELPAGSYAFFIVPGKDAWTLIFNKQGKQWGAYSYKADQDVLRFDVKPSAIPHQEYLAYEVQVESPERLHVELHWEKLAAGFDVDFNVKAVYWKYIEETLAKASPSQWRPWFQAARYCLDQDIQTEKALGWIETSIKATENGQNQECKARLLQKSGKTAEALAALDRAITLSRGKAPNDFVAELEKTREEWKAKSR